MIDLLAQPGLIPIANPVPRFSWVMVSPQDDDAQTAYEIRVGSSQGCWQQTVFCSWASGRVASDQSTAIPYQGKQPLLPSRFYYWAVRVWNKRGQASEWSAAQRFVMAARLSAPGAVNAPVYPLVKIPLAPAKIAKLGEGHWFIDFGRDAFASLQVDPIGGNMGRQIGFHLGEALEAPQRINRNPGGSVRYHLSPLVVDGRGTPYTIALPAQDLRRMASSIGAVMPFRYVEIENAPVELDPATLRQVVVRYPFDDEAARFESSDAALNAIWRMCHYTIEATSFAGLYVDGDRERTPYEADAYINQLGHYASDREFTLARHTLEYLMEHPTWPTEWVLQSVQMAWADYLYTGDDRSLTRFFPELEKKALAPESANRRDIVDWPEGERDGYDMRPVNTVVCAFQYRAYDLLGRIAKVLGKDPAKYEEQARRIAAMINDKLFDAQRGVYVDGEGSRHASLHANAMPLALGLVPPERRESVARFLATQDLVCSPYGAQYFLEALYEAGLGDRAFALLTSHAERSWSHMIDLGSTITLEAWDPKFKPNLDWNHAWGAAPANIIPRKLMGVEPLEPAFRLMRIRPQPGPLKKASLDLPTIRGTVHVEFEQDAARAAVSVELPANARAQVSWGSKPCGEFGGGKHRCEVSLR